jgi:esterase/lipase superfamily enzyme
MPGARLLPLIAAMASLALAGCAGRPEGMLALAEAPGGAKQVDLLAVTTRAPSGQPGLVFGGERADTVSFSNIVVSLPPDRAVGTVQWPSRLPANPATDFVATSITPLSQGNLLSWFKQVGGKKRRVFIFVHGFNTRFDTAVLRFAQLAYDTDADAAPVLFSWPSSGRILDYSADHDSATFSRSDLARLLLVAGTSPNVGEVTILAHSMGAWVAVEAVRQVALENKGVPAKIRNLVLASPDLDIDVFRGQIEDMGPRRPQITLFVSNNDRALALSRFVAGGRTRLGAIDLTREDYQKRLGGLPGVTVLDLSALQSGDRINHDVYAQSPLIVRLIGDRLIQGQVVTDSDVSAPLAAASGLSSAAGLFVAAPVLIFEAGASRSP